MKKSPPRKKETPVQSIMLCVVKPCIERLHNTRAEDEKTLTLQRPGLPKLGRWVRFPLPAPIDCFRGLREQPPFKFADHLFIAREMGFTSWMSRKRHFLPRDSLLCSGKFVYALGAAHSFSLFPICPYCLRCLIQKSSSSATMGSGCLPMRIRGAFK